MTSSLKELSSLSILSRLSDNPHRLLFFSLALGAGVRLVLAPFSFHMWELQTWNYASHELLTGNNPYTTMYELSKLHPPAYFYWAYFPLGLYLFSACHVLAGGGLFRWLGFQNVCLVDFPTRLIMAYKLPLILADIGVIYLLYKIGTQLRSQQVGALLALVWALNPYTILISGVWGHLDSLAVFFLVLAFYTLLNKRIWFSAVSLGLGIGAKTFPLLAVPILGWYVYRNQGFGRSLAYACLALAVPIVISLPFIFDDPNAFIYGTLGFHATRHGGGMTIWGIHMTLTHIGYPYFHYFLTELARPLSAFLIFSSYLFCIRDRESGTPEGTAYYVALTFLAYYIGGPLVNDPFALWALPFLMLLVATGHFSARYVKVFVALPVCFIFWNYAGFTTLFTKAMAYSDFIIKAHTFFAYKPALLHYLPLFLIGLAFWITAIVGFWPGVIKFIKRDSR